MDEPPPRQRPPWKDAVINAGGGVIAAGIVGVAALTWRATQGWDLRSGLVAPAALVTFAVAFAVLAWKRDAALDLLVRLMPVTAFVLLVAISGWLTREGVLASIEGYRLADYDPCAQRTELRVLTAPETRDSLQRLGEEFAAEQAGRHGCRPVRVSVSSASSLLDLESALSDNWRGITFRDGRADVASALLGAEPDIVIPPSSATIRYLRSKGVGNLHQERSLATSPLVVAVTAGQFQEMGPATGQTLEEIMGKARSRGFRIARPNPETSEVGLLATGDLYRGQAGEQQRRGVEQFLAEAPLAAGNSVELLCSIRLAQERSSPPQLAALVPENVLADHNARRALGDRCPPDEQGNGLFAVYPSDGHTLDYPFVRVDWPGQGGWQRDHMIGLFRDWLSPAKLSRVGLRDGKGRLAADGVRQTAEQGLWSRPLPPRPATDGDWLDLALKQYRGARTPLRVQIVVDLSGSMNELTADQMTRLARARLLARRLLRLISSGGTGDQAGLLVFPARGQGALSSESLKDMGPAAAGDYQRLDGKLATLTTTGGQDSPLYATVHRQLKGLAEGPAGAAGASVRPVVVVLTDGGDRVRQGPTSAEPDPAPQRRHTEAWLTELASTGRRLAALAPQPRVVMLPIGVSKWCAEDRGFKALAEVDIFSCRDEGVEDDETLLSRVLQDLRRG